MFKVALTGGVASGKSTVIRLFQAQGVPVIDADEVARGVVAPDGPAYEAVRQAFGSEYFHPDGTLNREKLGHRVFSHPEDRQRLNALIHPAIAQEMQRRLQHLEARREPLVIVEIPLLFELGLESAYDRVIVVYVDRDTQIHRLQSRDQRERAQIEGMLRAQLSLKDKCRRADYVIDNRGSCQNTRKQVHNILAEIRKNLLDKTS